MKKKIASIVLAGSLMLPINANAGVLEAMVNGMTTVSIAMVDGATSTSTDMLKLFAALADDIGQMADRILVMADNIGEMADRIVYTEIIMAGLANDIAGINNTVSAATAPVAILTQGFFTTLYSSDTPEFTLNSTPNEYIVYVSSSFNMTNNKQRVIVKNKSEFDAKWSELRTLAQNNYIYLAVKTIDGNGISSLSNVIEYRIYN